MTNLLRYIGADIAERNCQHWEIALGYRDALSTGIQTSLNFLRPPTANAPRGYLGRPKF